MKPAVPPLPIPTNLPFQILGNQTSKRISDPGAGVIVPATRQNDGKPAYGGGAPGGVGGPNAPAGGTKAPAAISSAAVMVVVGRFNFASSPHEMALETEPFCGASGDAGAFVCDGDCRLQDEIASAMTHTKDPR